jgi:hypothetical protein
MWVLLLFGVRPSMKTSIKINTVSSFVFGASMMLVGKMIALRRLYPTTIRLVCYT